MSVVGDINDFLRHSGSLKEAVQLLRDARDEIEKLTDDSLFLNCLRNAGVDNWEWYGEACADFQGINSDD